METKGIIISQKEYERLTELEKNFNDKVKENKETFKNGLEEPIGVKYDTAPFTKPVSFDVPVDKNNIRKLLYTRVPRKKKKWQKKQVAMIDGKPVKHLRYDYLGCYYWIK